MFSRKVLAASLFFVMLLAVASSAFAQEFRGSVAGTVTDSTGGRVRR